MVLVFPLHTFITCTVIRTAVNKSLKCKWETLCPGDIVSVTTTRVDSPALVVRNKGSQVEGPA